MLKLNARLLAIYGTPFRSQFDSPEATDEWLETWALGLAGLTGEQLKRGLARVLVEHPTWAPALGDFRLLCERSATRPEHKPALPEPRQPISAETLARVEAMAAGLRNAPSGEHDRYRWSLKIGTQQAVDYIARGGSDAGPLLAYMREHGVIDERNSLMARQA